MILIDTNVFLELFLDQRAADDCETLLGKVAEGEQDAVVTKFTLHSVEAILNNSQLILAFLRNIVNSTGLQVYDTSLDDEMAVAMLLSQMRLDFDDAIQYYAAKKLGADAIVSFDRHFDGLDLPRKEPKEVLGR